MRISIIICVVSVIISILIDLYIFFDLKKISKAVIVRKAYLISSIICWMLLIIVLAVPRRESNSILPVMWIIFAFLTIYIVKVLYLLFSLLGRIPLLFHKSPLRLGLYAGLPLGIVVFIAMWYGALFTTHAIDVQRVVLHSDHLPDSFNGFKIVQISDLHVGTWGNDTTFISTLVDSVNSLKPDVILFTGDIVNRISDELKPFVSPLSRLKAPMGVYSILGNHDYGDYFNWKSESDKAANLRQLKELQKKMGWNLLDNSHIFLHNGNDSIALIGVGNYGKPPFLVYGNLKKSYSGLKDSEYKILMSHNPDHWDMEVTDRSNIDLTLSGHTHAMQFKIGDWSPVEFKYKYWGGLYNKMNSGRSMNIYVNIGAGQVGIPARVGAIPEVTLITINRN